MAKCHPQIYANGEFQFYMTPDVSMERAEEVMRQLEKENPEYRYDWFSSMGRKIVKRLPKSELWTTEVPSEPGFYWMWKQGESAWLQHLHRSHHGPGLGFMNKSGSWTTREIFKTAQFMADAGYMFLGPLKTPILPEIEA